MQVNLIINVILHLFAHFSFKPRWKEHEILMAQSLEYKLDDYQLEQDWNNILSLANQPGASLEQAHIFALCHIFRRPIIVYSVKYVKSFRGENIGFTHFEGKNKTKTHIKISFFCFLRFVRYYLNDKLYILSKNVGLSYFC